MSYYIYIPTTATMGNFPVENMATMDYFQSSNNLGGFYSYG